jgi:hypothetical protein
VSTNPARQQPSVRPVVIFLHIGKTAGTTIRQILRKQYTPDDTLLIRSRPLRGEGEADRPTREATIGYFASLSEAERGRPSLILGHTIYGLHTSIPRPATYFTLLRDPVGLTISQYNYVARNPNHPLHGAASYRTLEAYVTSGVTLESDNSQTRAIAGDTATPFRGCTDAMLATAKSNIEKDFSVVGLVERFDESLMLLRDAFGWSDPLYVRANVTAKKEPVTDAARALIREQNRLDIELHAWTAARFDRAIAESPGFAEDLERFRRKNKRYSLWGRVTYSIPKGIARRVRKP